MTETRYRVYDSTDNEILANSIEDMSQAYMIRELLEQQHPKNKLTVESYTTTRHKGLGRDPDLYND